MLKSFFCRNPSQMQNGKCRKYQKQSFLSVYLNISLYALLFLARVLKRGAAGCRPLDQGKPYSLMDREQRRPLETFSTLSAAIRPFASVIPHMVLQSRGTLKGFSTLQTAVRPLCTKVKTETFRVTELKEWITSSLIE